MNHMFSNPLRILEYAAFFQSPIRIYPENNNEVLISTRIVDVLDNHFLIDATDVDLSKFENNAIRCVTQYKGRGISFNSFIENTEIDSKNHSIKIRNPEKYIITENRKSRRVQFDKQDKTLSIKLSSINKSLTVKNPIYISQDSIGLLFDKKDIFFQIGDELKIDFLRDKDSFFSSDGIIIRLNFFQSNNLIRALCVIGFQFQPHIEQQTPTTSSQERRRVDRRKSANNSTFVEFTHPFFSSHRIFGDIRNLSSSTIEFTVSNKFPLLPGMHLNECSIQLPKSSRHNVRLKVIKVESNLSLADDQALVACEFLSLNTLSLMDISSYASQLINPNLMDATLNDLGDLWEFFFEVGFIYRGKRLQMQNNSRNIYKTFSKLLSPNNSIAKFVLYKENNQIHGHISTIRIFDSSWIIQHFSAKPSEKIAIGAKSVIFSVTTFFKNIKANNTLNTKFVSTFYRPDNIFPAAVFNGVTEVINNQEICDCIDYQFCLEKNNSEDRKSASKAHEASNEELDLLFKLLLEKGDEKLIEMENLNPVDLNQLKISRDYNDIGLYRFRRVFTIFSDSTRLFAVCNYSSPGVNLSELTNSFRIVSRDQNNKDYSILLNDLTDSVLGSYNETELQSPVLLLENGQVVPNQFEIKKVYTQWRLNVSKIESTYFVDAIEKVFKNLKKYVLNQKRKLEPNSSPGHQAHKF